MSGTPPDNAQLRDSVDLENLLRNFLTQEGAFDSVHTKHRSLGAHLLGTYSILANVFRTPPAVSVAGGLHSVYGTSIFKRITISPSRRGEVAAKFGERAERLAFLFGACRRPGDLERGILVARAGREDRRGKENSFSGDSVSATAGVGREEVVLPCSTEDLWALRLVEAANLLDQHQGRGRKRKDADAVLGKYPRILAVWKAHVRSGSIRRASEIRRKDKERSREHPSRWGRGGCFRWIRWLKTRRTDVFGIRLRCGGTKEAFFPFPLPTELVSHWLLQFLNLEEGEAGRGRRERRPKLGFRFSGEEFYGMPIAPLSTLNFYRRCQCSGSEQEKLPPLDIMPALYPDVVVRGPQKNSASCDIAGRDPNPGSGRGTPPSPDHSPDSFSNPSLDFPSPPVLLSDLSSFVGRPGGAFGCSSTTSTLRENLDLQQLEANFPSTVEEDFRPKSSSTVDEKFASAAALLVRSLRTRGYAILRGDDHLSSAQHVTEKACHSICRVCSDVGEAAKARWKLKFDEGRFVGWSSDAGRHWLQFRKGAEDPKRFPGWPEAAEEERNVFATVFARADTIARIALRAILKTLNHVLADNADEALLDTDADLGGGGPDFGASVMRFFVYRNDCAPSPASISKTAGYF